MANFSYQEQVVAELLEAWRDARRVLLVMPTGSGKTRVAARALGRSEGRIVWVVHRRELVLQAHRELCTIRPRHEVGIIMAGEHGRSGAAIQVCSVDTLLARDMTPNADVVVFDEAHHYRAITYQQVVDRYPEAKHLLLTATPQRGDGSPLAPLVDRVLHPVRYSDLLERGVIVPAIIGRPDERHPRFDMVGRDWAMPPAEAYGRFARDTKALGFLPSVAACRQQQRIFRESGVRCELVTHDTSRAKRGDVLRRFERGDVQVVLCCDTLTEGYDTPDCETVILGRVFRFVGAYMQAAGRGLRSSPGKQHVTILDLTGCTIAHGSPTEDRDWLLEGDGEPRMGQASAGPEGGYVPISANVPLVGLAHAPPRPARGRYNDLKATRLAEWLDNMSPARAAARFMREFGEWPDLEEA